MKKWSTFVMEYYVYLSANKPKGKLYSAICRDIPEHLKQRRSHVLKRILPKNKADQVVYYERFKDEKAATNRKRQLDKWSKTWKMNLVNNHNPGWKNLVDKFDRAVEVIDP